MQVNYKNVMEQYGLGPNGGILTSLNLFATKFDQASIDVRQRMYRARAASGSGIASCFEDTGSMSW